MNVAFQQRYAQSNPIHIIESAAITDYKIALHNFYDQIWVSHFQDFGPKHMQDPASKQNFIDLRGYFKSLVNALQNEINLGGSINPIKKSQIQIMLNKAVEAHDLIDQAYRFVASGTNVAQRAKSFVNKFQTYSPTVYSRFGKEKPTLSTAANIVGKARGLFEAGSSLYLYSEKHSGQLIGFDIPSEIIKDEDEDKYEKMNYKEAWNLYQNHLREIISPLRTQAPIYGFMPATKSLMGQEMDPDEALNVIHKIENDLRDFFKVHLLESKAVEETDESGRIRKKEYDSNLMKLLKDSHYSDISTWQKEKIGPFGPVSNERIEGFIETEIYEIGDKFTKKIYSIKATLIDVWGKLVDFEESFDKALERYLSEEIKETQYFAIEMLIQESTRGLPISVRVGQVVEKGHPLIPVRRIETVKESPIAIYRGLIDETRNDFETIFDQMEQFLTNKYSTIDEKVVPNQIQSKLVDFATGLNDLRKNFDITVNTFDNDINEIRDEGEEGYRQDLLRNRVVRDIDSRFFGSLATLEEALNDFKHSQEQIIQIMKNADKTVRELVGA